MVFLKQYSWGSGVQYKVPAEVVGNTLEDIEKNAGAVTKELFLDASRPDSSPTHSLFDWDDKSAAEKYRLVQSGRIINNLVVTIKKSKNDDPIATKAVVNVSVKDKEKATFVSTIKAMSDEGQRNNVLRRALHEMQAYEDRYRSFKELEKVFKAFDDVKRQ